MTLAETLQSLSARLPTSPYLTAALAVLLVALAMPLFGRSKRFDPVNKHCYIGGGSEGLGFALACQLAKRGAHVTIVSRSQAKLDKALEEIETHRQSPSQTLQAFSCDLTDPAASASTIQRACAPFASSPSSAAPPPDYIFACAGGSYPGFFADFTAQQHWECMEWNFRSCLNTIHEGVQMIRDQGKTGTTIVLTSSVLGMFSFVGYSTYSPSKYAIRGLAEALRNELIMYGTSVHLFCPATIFSPSYLGVESQMKPEITKKIEEGDDGMTPEQVASELIKGLWRKDFVITYEFVGHALRTSRGSTPWGNPLSDMFWGLIGTVALPLWRRFGPDAAVKKEALKLRQEKAAKKD
ncbi:hypothetical protein JCM10207_001220 [Rhodosporidiobolus poonsookiae]